MPGLFVLARHGQSTLNVTRRVNSDPTVDVPLTGRGTAEARSLGEQVSALGLDLCVHTPFPRTRQTAELAVGGRGVPLREEPLLGDIDVGELEGRSLDEYRAYKRGRGRDERFPGGESLDEAALRYMRAFRGLLDGEERRVLVVCHEIPVRWAVNAASGSGDLESPVHDVANATPYLFDEAGLRRAADELERLAAP